MANPLLDFLAGPGVRAGEAVSRGTLALGDFVASSPGVIPRVEKLKEDEEKHLFTRIFGIPTPFLQLGTYFGAEGWNAVALDIITDPTTYLGGWGSLTRAGKAGKIARAAEGAEKVTQASKGMEVVQGLAGAKSPELATATLGKLAKRSAQLSTHGHQKLLDVLSLADNDIEALKLLDEIEKARPAYEVTKETGKAAALEARAGGRTTINFRGGTLGTDTTRALLEHFPGRMETIGIRNAIAKKGLDAGRQVLQEAIDRRKDLSALLGQFAQAGDAQTALRLMKEIDRLEPNRAFKTMFGKRQREYWKAYFREAAKGAVKPLARGVRAQAESGQRALLTFRAPLDFTGATEKVIATGAPILESVAKASKRIPGLRNVGKGFAFAGAGVKAAQQAGAFDHTPAFDSVAKLGDVVLDGIRATDTIRQTAPAEVVDDISKEYWGRVEQARGAAAAMANEVKYLMGDKADDMRMVLDDPGKWMRYPGNPIVRGNLKPEVAAKFADRELEFMETLRTMHERINTELAERGIPVLDNYTPRVGIGEDYAARLEEEMLKAPPALKGSKTRHFYKRGEQTLEQMFAAGKSEHDAGKVYQSWVEGTLKTLVRKDVFNRIKHSQARDGLPLFAYKGSKVQKANEGLYVATKDPSVVALATHGGPRGPREILTHKDHVREVIAAFGRQELTALAGKPRDSIVVDALLKLNSLNKRAAFGIDAVQYGAFTERAGGVMGRAFMQDPVAQVKRGAWHITRASDQWQRAMNAGLKLNVIDNDIDSFESALDMASKAMEKIPVVGGVAGAPFRAWRKWSSTIDKPVWNYYHPSLKMTAFTELYDKALRDPRFVKLSGDEIAQGVAAHVNNAFSGLNWERMWIGAPGQKWLRLLMIAPDWTLSTIKVGADLFANQVARAPFFGRDMVAPTVRAAYARDYALRAALLGGALAEMVNLATTSDPGHFLKTGHLNGHYMHENEPGRKTQIALPIHENERRLYMKQQKNFQDMLDLVSVWDSEKGPRRFFGNRMGFVPSLFYTTAYARDSFGYPIVSVKDGPLKQIYDLSLGILGTGLPAPVGTAIGAGAAGPRPIRAALEMGLSVSTGREERGQKEIDLKQEPVPPPDPIPVEFQAAIEEEVRQNPQWVERLATLPMEPLLSFEALTRGRKR